MRLTNPFLFFVQAVFFVNVEPTSQGAYYDSPGNWTDHRVSGVISSSECIAKTKVIGLRNWTPLLPAHRTPPSTTSPVTAHKREASARFATSGHGGGVGTMRLTNPFLFFVQAVFFVNSGTHITGGVLRQPWKLDRPSCFRRDFFIGMHREDQSDRTAQLDTTTACASHATIDYVSSHSA
ncbi:hypothetical protein V5799_026568 [Amblyomma americanum]|uniref:Secreted protein n=1 Tax=Amblyomma americanum TaxID=6943 RepID=A0AAQ4DI74_AMBAM